MIPLQYPQSHAGLHTVSRDGDGRTLNERDPFNSDSTERAELLWSGLSSERANDSLDTG